jgi:hypothetical protein
MIFIIITITVILFAILLRYTWHRLDTLEKHIKIIYIIIGLILMALITLIIFNISSIGIQYEKIGIKKDIRNILLLVFTPINALFIMPSFAKMLSQINNDEIKKDKLISKIVITLFIFAIVLIIECSYLKSIQLGIIEIYQKLK